MIVREKAPRHIAYTWQEFIHNVSCGEFYPKVATFMGLRCELNSTRTGYFVYDKHGNTHIMNENSVMMFYDYHYDNMVIFDAESFWNTYEQVIFK